jgi:hypothetical protein
MNGVKGRGDAPLALRGPLPRRPSFPQLRRTTLERRRLGVGEIAPIEVRNDKQWLWDIPRIIHRPSSSRRTTTPTTCPRRTRRTTRRSRITLPLITISFIPALNGLQICRSRTTQRSTHRTHTRGALVKERLESRRCAGALDIEEMPAERGAGGERGEGDDEAVGGCDGAGGRGGCLWGGCCKGEEAAEEQEDG